MSNRQAAYLAEIVQCRHRNSFTTELLEQLAAMELVEFKYTGGGLSTRLEYRIEWNKTEILGINSPHSSTYGSLNKCSRHEI